MVRLKFHQKMPLCLFTSLSLCLFDFLTFVFITLLPFCLLLSTYVFFCGVFVYSFAFFCPFCYFSLLGFVSSTSSKCLKYLNFAQCIRHVQCNVSCSQYTSRCECIFHDIEKERNREGEKQSWRLHWELRAIVALSCPESTFDNNSYIFKALLQARIRLNSTLRTVVPLTMFDNIQVRYGYCLMQQKCTQMQT